jgi:hypothetical protein
MPKTFLEAFEEWKRDTRYQVGDDIGWEHPDQESCPTQEESSLTPNEDGDESSTQA